MPAPKTPFNQRVTPWTPDEWTAIVRWGVKHWENNNRTVRRRYEQAQAETLPVERRRPFDPAKQSKWNKEVQAILGVVSPDLLANVPMTASAEPVERPGGWEANQPAEPVAAAPSVEPSVPEPKTFGQVAEELIGKALELPAVRDAILAMVAHHFKISDPVSNERVPTGNVIKLRPRERLIKVLVVARLKGSRVAELNRAFPPDTIDLVYWSTDQSIQELRNKVGRAEVVIIQTDNCSHAALETVKAKAAYYIGTTGGMASLKREINHLLYTESEANK